MRTGRPRSSASPRCCARRASSRGSRSSDEGTPTAEDAARAVGCGLAQIVKSLLFACDDRWVLAMIPGDRRADRAKIAAAAGAPEGLDRRARRRLAHHGIPAGGVAPFPLPGVHAVLIEQTMLSHDVVWIGAGSPRHVAALTPADLVRLSRARRRPRQRELGGDMPEFERSASVVWEGGLTEGSGTLDASSGAFAGLPVTWASRVESSDGRTSPEELIAAAHAACYAMAFSNVLAGAGHPPERLQVSAVVSAELADGLHVKSSELTVVGRVPGLDQSEFERHAPKPSAPVPSRTRFGALEIRVNAAGRLRRPP